MIQGALIARDVSWDLRLTVRRITRQAPDGTTDQQPPVWTAVYLVRVDE
jgi:hypothetical protein